MDSRTEFFIKNVSRLGLFSSLVDIGRHEKMWRDYLCAREYHACYAGLSTHCTNSSIIKNKQPCKKIRPVQMVIARVFQPTWPTARFYRACRSRRSNRRADQIQARL